MYATMSLFLAAMMGLNGMVDLRLPQIKVLDHFARHRVQRPIRDPDDGSGRTFEQDKPRLDRFAKEIKENSSADAYIIAYGGLESYKNEAKIRLKCIRKYLTTTHRIPRSRLKLIDGGYRVEVSVQLFLVKPGDPKPTPYPIVNREAVRIKKAPKSTCG